MKKSASIISAALLVFGLAAGSMAADAPKTTADAGAASSDAPKAHKHKTSHKSARKKAKKAAKADSAAK